ncbi:proliferation marker protein Ki-67 [Dugong dugon]
MGPLGRLVVIRRTGSDGTHFPLCRDTCLFGRGIECDIRIQLPVVSQKHCKIDIRQQEAVLINFSTTNPTQLNGAPVNEPVKLKHGDIITIIDRSFRKTPNASPRKPKMRLGYPEVTSSHTSSFDDSTSDITENKSEEMSFKRRRVSFGGLLRPELFDENLPPNTPLKRGETPGKRKSLGIPAPTVLKKIMREQSLAPEKGESSSNVLSEAKSSTASNSSKSQRPNNPKRRSEKIPSRRKSVDKNTLQIIFPKRRSSTSKAKLPGGKSWADVVKLGAKKQQIKNIKQDAQRHISKKQRRKPTPQKPLDHIENPFSTGHANSPCTVIIGRAHVDKVNVPARPYRMLNNFILNKKITYTEDLSGLTEMFKTPGKEKPQRTNVCPDSIKRSEIVFEEAKLGEKPETLDVIDKILLSTKQEVEVEDISQKPSKQKPKPGETLAALKTWLKTPNVTPELLEDLCSKKDRTPTPESPRKSISGDVPRKIWKTTKCTPESREMTRMSPRLWRNPCASPELRENLTGMNNHMQTLKSPGESISNEEVHTEIQKTPKRTPKSGETSRKALSLLRNTSASPELVEDLASMEDQMPTPESPGEPSGDDHRKIQKTLKRTSKSGETPRMSLRLLRDPTASPELAEDLAGIKDQTPTPKSPGESISNEEVHREIQKTPKRTPKSGETSRKSLRLQRNPSASPGLMEDLASVKDQTPILESPGELVSGDDHKKIQKTPKCTPKSGETPRMSLRLLRDPTASPELVEDLSGMIDSTLALESRAESISGEEVHREIQKTPKRTAKSGETSRKSLRLQRNPSASPELMEDLASVKDQMPTLESPGESVSGDDHRKIQKTLKRTPKSGETPRMSLRLLRDPTASPELVEDLSGMIDSTPALESPAESISGEEVHREIEKTPKWTAKSGETSRKSLRLQRNPSASPELMEDLASVKDQTPTLESPGESVSGDDHRKIQKTLKRTSKSGETPRMSLRLLRDATASPELVEDLSGMVDSTPALESPAESISGEEVHREIQKTPKRTPKSAKTPKMSMSLLRNPHPSPEFAEDLPGIKDHMPALKSPKESVNNGEVHREIQKTPQQTPKSGETPRMSLRLLRNPSINQELLQDLPGIKIHKPTLKSPGESISGDDHREIWKTPKCIPKSGETPRMSLRLLRDPTASPELVEDLLGMITPMPALESSAESISGEVHRQIQKTRKRTPKSGETPRMSLRLLRNPSASPELAEDLVSMKDHTPALKSPRESISNEKVHTEIQKTPKWTPKSRESPKSGETPRMSLSLLRNPSASQELVEDLASMKDQMPTMKSPGESVSGDDDRKIQKTPKCTSKSAQMPRMSLRLLRSPSANPELVEDLASMKDQTPTLESPGESVSGDGHRKIQKTPKHTLKSEETPRLSLTLLGDLSASPELMEDLSGMIAPMPTLESAAESISGEEVHREIRKTPKCTPKSGEMQRKSLRLLRNPSASQELVEDLGGINDHTPTLKSPGESISNEELHREIQKTLKHTPKSEESPRMSPRLWRNPSASPELMEDLSGMNDHMPTPKSTGESISNEEVHREIQKTPKYTPKSRETPRMSLSLLRNPSASPKLVEDLAGIKDQTPTAKSPGVSISCDDQRKTQKTPKHTLKSEETPRMSPRLCKDPNATLELVEDPASMKDHTPTPREPDEPESLVSPIGKSLLRPPLKIKPEPVQALTLNLLKTPPQTVQPEHQAVNTKLGAAPREESEPLTGVRKHLRNSTKNIAPVEEPTGIKTPVRMPKRSYEWMGNLSGLKSLMKTPRVHPEEDSTHIAKFPTESDSGILTSPEKLQESQVLRRPVTKGSPVEDLEPPKLMEVASAAFEETSDSATKNKDGPGDSQENPSCNPCEDESQNNASEKNMEYSGINQRTRYALRNKGGPELQESKHLAHQTEKVESETNVKTTEPSIQANLRQGTSLRSRRRCKADTEVQESQLLPTTETIQINKGEMKILKSSQKKTSEDGPMKEKAVSLRSRGRSKTGINLPETESLASLAEVIYTEEDDKPMESLQEKIKPPSEEKIVLRSRKKTNSNFGLVTRSNKIFPAKTEEPDVSSSTAARVSVSNDEKTVTHSLDKVFTEKIATRGLRSRCGPGTINPGSEASHSPLSTTEKADSGEVGKTRGRKHQKCKETALKQEARVKTRHQRTHLGEETQHSHSLPAPCEEVSTDKEAALRQETRVKTRHQRTRLGEETQHSHSLPVPREEVSADKEAALRQETRVKTRHQRTRLGEETQHSHSLPAPCEEVSTDKEAALRQETRVKTRHQRTRLGEETQHSHSLPVPREEVSADKEAALRQETRVKTRHQRTRLGEETQHSHSLPAPCEEVSTDKEAALRQETRVKTRHQRTRLGEETQHSHSLPVPREEVSADKEAALRQETRVKTRHQRTRLGEETQHSHSLPAPCEEVSTDKEAALRQETRVKTRHQRTRLGEEMQHSHSLPAPCEEVSTDKDGEDKRMLNHTVPPQDGRRLRSRSRNKVSTDPEGLQSVASSTEIKRTKKVTKMSVKKSRQQEEAAATEAIPCSRPGRRNKVPVTTTKMQGSDPEPSTENTLEKSAEDPSGKVSEDTVTVLGIPPSRLRSRNQTKSVAELCSKETSTKEPSHKQSDIKSLQRATRASKRGISEETATKNPKQDKNIIPTKRMRTRRYQGNEDA